MNKKGQCTGLIGALPEYTGNTSYLSNLAISLFFSGVVGIPIAASPEE